jgi:UTP-glucose-1-phosphate uridylyltransferase
MLAAGLAKRYGGCKPLAPLGIHGEAIIDLTASDALAAGFSRVVIVVGPQTGPALSYHVRRSWPEWAQVSTALQPVPLGTAHALLCARDELGNEPFGVVNADDVYGSPALSVLAKSLEEGRTSIVAFRLADTILTGEPVTRGVVVADDQGALAGLAERRKVTRNDDGTFSAGDGLEPAQLDPDSLVSMNLWGFQPGIWRLLEDAVAKAHPESSDEEVLLPEVVAEAVSEKTLEVTLEEGPGRCIGVTHADDLPVARAELARMIGRGERAEALWQHRT